MYLINELEQYLLLEVEKVKIKKDSNERHITLLEILMEINKLKQRKQGYIPETTME